MSEPEPVSPAEPEPELAAEPEIGPAEPAPPAVPEIHLAETEPAPPAEPEIHLAETEPVRPAEPEIRPSETEPVRPPGPEILQAETEPVLSVESAPEGVRPPAPEVLNGNDYFRICVPLYNAALEGNWEAAEKIIENHSQAILGQAIAKGGSTILHVAAGARKRTFVEKLLNSTKKNHDLISTLLLQGDDRGNNAFCLAAATGDVEIAKLMLKKEPILETVRGFGGMTPLYLAVLFGQKDMVNFLYRTVHIMGQDELEDLFIESINTDLYGIAFKLLTKWVSSNEILRIWERQAIGATALHMLAQKPNLKTDGALTLVNLLWESLINSQTSNQVTALITSHKNILFDAAKLGNFEFIAVAVGFYPDLIYEFDDNMHSIFHFAVQHRHVDIIGLINMMGFHKDLLTNVDNDGNNILHLAAKYPDPPPANMVPGAALELQREILMFEFLWRCLGIFQCKYRYFHVMNTKKGKGRGQWTKTHSISRIYGNNSSKDVEKQPSNSVAPTPLAPSNTPVTPQNSSTFIAPSSTKRVHAPKHPTPVPILPSHHQTTPLVSHASTTTIAADVTPTITCARTPTTTPPEIRDASLIEQDRAESTRKNKRGITRGLDLLKRKHLGDRIGVDISKGVMRAVGENSQFYITDTGCIVRRYAPLQFNGWKDIPRIEVDRLILRVREKFKLSNEAHVNEAIEEDMKRRYTRWRYTLHEKYLELIKRGEDLVNPPDDRVDVKDWEYLVKLWQNDKWKQKSERNKENNKKIQFHHCAGTKAFSRLRWENRNLETGDLPGCIDTFKLSRYDEENDKWVDDDAKKAYDEMNMLRTNPPEELQHMSEDEIYDYVLGESPSGYIRGLGAGPKPKRSSTVTARRCAQLEEATRRAEEAETRSEQLADELTTVKAELAEMRSNFNEKLLEIQAQLRERG